MRIHKVTVRNFRLLADVELALETPTTLIVGRNNSGKTSLFETIRRFLMDQNPRFQVEGFSNTSYDCFCDALAAKHARRPDDEGRALIPSIELRPPCSATTPPNPTLALSATSSSISTSTAARP